MQDEVSGLPLRASDLPQDEERRFHEYAYARLRRSLMTLMLAMPVLLLVGWIRDYVVVGQTPASTTLIPRAGLVAVLLAIALPLRRVRLRGWHEWLAIAYLGIYGIGIVTTTLHEPARLSMLHVVTALMLIIWLQFALRPWAVAGVIVVLCLPLAVSLHALDAGPLLDTAYGVFCLVGIGIGLACRQALIATWLELYLTRQRLLERLHEDALTGVSNREAWHDIAARVHQETLRDGHASCVLFFDIDQFKSINDDHGHAVGDVVLQQVSRVMQRNLRPGQLLARMGGEEFVALLPRVALVDALRVAERIRAEVRTIPGATPVTVSAGVALARVGEALTALTERADAAMLEAKRQGRDRVIAAN